MNVKIDNDIIMEVEAKGLWLYLTVMLYERTDFVKGKTAYTFHVNLT